MDIFDNFIDELRVEGVNFKGFGIIPKLIMIDDKLPIASKGICAYFYSYAGSGNTAFPGWEKIVHDLKINKETYFKYFKVLETEGYISVEKRNLGGNGHGFQKNIYTLISCPKKYKTLSYDNLHADKDRVLTEGIKAGGYGTIPKAVMIDSRLDLKEKALYAFFCSFAGSGNTAFPKKKDILYFLHISDSAYRTYMKSLTSYGLITVTQTTSGGKFGSCLYTINENPVIPNKKEGDIIKSPCVDFPEAQIPEAQNEDSKESSNITESPCVDFSEAQKTEVQTSETQIPEAKNNNIIKNSIYNKQSISHSNETITKEERGKDEILSEISSFNEIPEEYLNNKKLIKLAVDLLCTYAGHEDLYSSLEGFNKSFPELFKSALTSMLSDRKGQEYENIVVSSEDIRRGVSKFISKDYITGNPTIMTLMERTKEIYKEAANISQPKYPIAFCRRMIWNAIIQGDCEEITTYEI